MTNNKGLVETATTRALIGDVDIEERNFGEKKRLLFYAFSLKFTKSTLCLVNSIT